MQQTAELAQAQRRLEAELERMRAENRRNADIVAAARNSRTFRFTRLPRALREPPGDED